MSLWEILCLAVGLALDAFAVSLGVGTARLAPTIRPIFRLSFHFGLFQFFMPVLGWLSGYHIAKFISAWDHWLVFGLLTFIGGRMVRSGFAPEASSYSSDPSRGWTLVFLSVATSLDAFAIGLSLAMLGEQIWYPSMIIGVVTAGLSLLGLLLGHRLGQRFGQRMEIFGGLLLLGIGLRVLIAHMM
jgi:manganese efflux pump family protein